VTPACRQAGVTRDKGQVGTRDKEEKIRPTCAKATVGKENQSINHSANQSTNQPINKYSMVRHIVMWTIRETGSPRGKLEAMAEMKSKLLALKQEIREIVSVDVHFNSISASQDNYEVVLECEFRSWADLEAYQKHPAHLVVKEYIKNIRQSRAAVDYEF
jgi:hypothetical protein